MKKIIILFVFLSTQLNAEPNKTAKYLMNDSFTMFEWGLYQIEDTLAKKNFSDLDLIFRTIVSTEYDWESNQIKIDLVIYPSFQKISSIGEKEACRTALTDIKQHFGFGYDDERRSILSISSHFKHKGFINKSEPKTFMGDIEKMAKVTVKIYSSKDNKPNFSNKAICTSKLLEKDIYFVDKKKI